MTNYHYLPEWGGTSCCQVRLIYSLSPPHTTGRHQIEDAVALDGIDFPTTPLVDIGGVMILTTLVLCWIYPFWKDVNISTRYISHLLMLVGVVVLVVARIHAGFTRCMELRSRRRDPELSSYGGTVPKDGAEITDIVGRSVEWARFTDDYGHGRGRAHMKIE